MAIDLVCHTTLPLDEVNAILFELKKNNNNFFDRKFSLYGVSKSRDIDREIAEEFNLENCKTSFRVHLNNKDFSHELPDISFLVKGAFPDKKLIVLFDNEILY
jgi:hypothetical protein